MVPGDCCFYAYCVNVSVHRKKKMFRDVETMRRSHCDTFQCCINVVLFVVCWNEPKNNMVLEKVLC